MPEGFVRLLQTPLDEFEADALEFVRNRRAHHSAEVPLLPGFPPLYLADGTNHLVEIVVPDHPVFFLVLVFRSDLPAVEADILELRFE